MITEIIQVLQASAILYMCTMSRQKKNSEVQSANMNFVMLSDGY